MAKGGKARTVIVRLISTAQTGFFYTTKRVRLNSPKLSAVKYDPIGAQRVSLFQTLLEFMPLNDSKSKSVVCGESENEEMNVDVTVVDRGWRFLVFEYTQLMTSHFCEVAYNRPPTVRTPLNNWQVKRMLRRSLMEPERYALQLNRTHLLFIPSLRLVHDLKSTLGTVVQVCLRGKHEDGDAFAVEQASITRTIETLLVGHVNASRKLPKCVVIKEVIPGYTLIGERKPWKYGHGKNFCLGDTTLQPAEDKWAFHFENTT